MYVYIYNIFLEQMKVNNYLYIYIYTYTYIVDVETLYTDSIHTTRSFSEAKNVKLV